MILWLKINKERNLFTYILFSQIYKETKQHKKKIFNYYRKSAQTWNLIEFAFSIRKQKQFIDKNRKYVSSQVIGNML